MAVNLTPQIEHLSKYLNTAADGLKFVLDKLDKNNSKSTASVYKERHAKNGFYGDITNQVHATAHAVPEDIGTGISEIGDYLGKGIIWWLNDNDVSQQTKPGAPAKPRWPQIIDNTTSNNPKIAPLPNFGLKPGNDNGALDLQNIDKILSPLNGGSLPANSTNHSWNVKIDVNGSEKPHETAMEVRRQIEDLTTFQQFGNGGLA